MDGAGTPRLGVYHRIGGINYLIGAFTVAANAGNPASGLAPAAPLFDEVNFPGLPRDANGNISFVLAAGEEIWIGVTTAITVGQTLTAQIHTGTLTA
jgi:hypothetical protein